MSDPFLVARNPDPDSKLPYLLRLPIESGIVLKARETWPRTKTVPGRRVGLMSADKQPFDRRD
ncbi:MAG: hypothetical protein ACXVQY_04660 [Actinomycetota bacterium]